MQVSLQAALGRMNERQCMDVLRGISGWTVPLWKAFGWLGRHIPQATALAGQHMPACKTVGRPGTAHSAKPVAAAVKGLPFRVWRDCCHGFRLELELQRALAGTQGCSRQLQSVFESAGSHTVTAAVLA